MYKKGEWIVYGNSGACQVEQVGVPGKAGLDAEKRYYKLMPLNGTEIIYTPVDTTVFMRPVISRQEAEELVAQIPSIRGDTYANRNLAMLKEHYDASLQSHCCEDLVQLIKSVYSKHQDAIQDGKRLGQVDRRYMKRAEELLYGELSVALEIPQEEVVLYIERSLQDGDKEMNAAPNNTEKKKNGQTDCA